MIWVLEASQGQNLRQSDTQLAAEMPWIPKSGGKNKKGEESGEELWLLWWIPWAGGEAVGWWRRFGGGVRAFCTVWRPKSAVHCSLEAMGGEVCDPRWWVLS